MTNDNFGHIYCMWNEVFKYYGDEIYKLGRAENPKNECPHT
jgi:hypothetical protein